MYNFNRKYYYVVVYISWVRLTTELIPGEVTDSKMSQCTQFLRNSTFVNRCIEADFVS